MWDAIRNNYVDYEEPDPPQSWERMRCGKGHFVSSKTPSLYWVEYDYPGPYDGPRYRLAEPGERPDEIELWCPACDGWFTV